RTWDYFNNKFQRNGPAGKNPIKIFTNYSGAKNNWMLYSADQTGSYTDEIWIMPGNCPATVVAFDVLAHEMTHAYIKRSSQVGSDQAQATESKALNEGFCDIFGLLAE